MRIEPRLMLATKIPTGLKLIDHNEPARDNAVNIYEGDYLFLNPDGTIRPHFSAYAELIKRGGCL